jgi:hypothetical protein
LAVAIFEPPSQSVLGKCVSHAPLIVVFFFWLCKSFLHLFARNCEWGATEGAP